ncbi:MAG: DUF4783 domain-containing protein [Bacteroidales bacterium]|jgi:hypothetical protein|nr:DUF4783 domain-containing protein [Bacteroidales bacterium]
MKKIVLILSFLHLFCFAVTAQDKTFVLTEIKPLIEKQDATGLKSYMASAVSLNLPGQKGIFNKQQAEKQLQTFFKKLKNPVFELLESGNTTDTKASYLIGNLKDETTTFRVYILIQTGNKQIQSIEISQII